MPASARRPSTPAADLEQEGFDMTPMIDCTFQLIIFFMLVSDMARVRTDPVTLPSATKAARVPNPDDLVVNILPDGRVRVDGRGYSDEALEALFARRRPKAESGIGYPLVLRADRSTAFEHVQKIMSMAVAHGALSRIQFSAKQEETR